MLSIFFALRRLRRLKYYDSEKGRHRRGVFRVFGFGLAASLSLGTCAAYSSAETRLTEGSLGIGRELLPLADLLRDSHRLQLNGESIWVTSSYSPQDPKTVLERFETHCRKNTQQAAEDWKTVPELRDLNNVMGDGSNPFTFLRKGSESEGVVLCFVQPSTEALKSGGDEAGKPSRFQALMNFAKTSDFGHLGAMRYAYVKGSDKGGSTIVSLWTENHFRLDHLFPKDGGEVPGTDLSLAPRPKGDSIRLLSAHLDGTPFGVYTYQSSFANAAEAYAYYDDAMKERGFLRLIDDKHADEGRGYMKLGVLVAVSTSQDPNGGTVVTIGDLGEPDFANAPKMTVARENP